MADIFNQLKDKLGEKITGNLLASPQAYKIARLLIQGQKFTLEASKKLAMMALKQAGDAYEHRAPVVWTSAFFPGELIHALGLIPFAPEVGAAGAASLNLAAGMLQRAEENRFATDGCSFHRCAAGGARDHYFPQPDLLAASSHLCDGAPQLFKFLAKQHQKPFLHLDIPAVHDSEAEHYVANQLKKLAGIIEVETGRKLTREKINETFLNANRARETLIEVNWLRKYNPAPLNNAEGLAYLYLVFLGQGHPQTPNIYEMLAHEIKNRIASGRAQKPVNKELRLLWLHLKPYYQDELLQHLENELHCRIVFEEMNYVHWEPLNPQTPYISLARKSLSHPSVGSLEKRITLINDLVVRYHADAVIQFSHWGCHQAVGGTVLLKRSLAEKNIPFLSLDGDCVDSGSFPSGQAKTRAESFVEMLRN